MASLAELTPTPGHFWPEAAAQEKSDSRRSDVYMKRYEALLRLSSCLTSTRPEDWVTNITVELRPVIDFDLLDIVVDATASLESGPASNGPDEAVLEVPVQLSGDTRGKSGGVICLPLGEEVKTQLSIPLIS